MNAKYKFSFYLISLFLLLCQPAVSMAVAIDELADICEAMESAIVDISLEYEWYNIPPWTIEESEREMGMPMLTTKDGVRRYKLSAAGLLFNRDPNDLNWTLPERLLFEVSATIMDADGNTWDSVRKESYNGKIYKHLQIGGWPRVVRSGGVSYEKRSMLPMTLTPIGFSVLRLSVRGDESVPLSARLRDKEFVRLDNTVEKVNGFNTIRADLLQYSSKNVYLRIYFSVDHGYTPVRYKHGSLAFEVHSLEQVVEGLWFPSSGLISDPDDERVDAFQTISEILVNQGLTDEHFDIEFPPGTEVWDEVRDLEYVVKPTEEQFEQ